jgi:sugar (pentulose or hexulose) kinase/phosphoglycerate dehydrogenase-like enzyme
VLSRSFLLGLDIGGGGGRCLLVDVASAETTSLHQAWSFASDPADPTAADIDPERVWRVLGECVRRCLAKAGARPAQVLGIAATSMRHASAVVDAAGAAILMTTNQDARGLHDCLGLATEHGAELQRRTGHWPNPVQAAGRLRWLAREDPDGWRRAALHLSLSDWLAARLCGVHACDPSQASETLLFELATRTWAWDLIERLGLPRRLFPEIRESGSRLGELSAAAASDLGLAPGIPVAVGGGDTQCGLLGAGVVSPGSVGIVAGTTVPLQLVTDRARLDEQARLWSAHHLVPGHWVLESNAGAMGSTAEWIAGLLFCDAAHPLLHLFGEAAEAPVGAGGIVSTLGAEVMNARELGLPIGNLSMSPMLGGDPPERRRQLARAIVEGFAFALRANLEQLESVAGAAATSVRITGGLSRSRFFSQLVSDALGRELSVTATPESSALGAAICAGVGAGLFADVTAGAAALVRVARICRPAESSSSAYAELYPAWNELRIARLASNTAAAGLAIRGLLARRSATPRAADVGMRPRLLVTAEMDADAIGQLAQLGDVDHRSYKQAMRLLRGATLARELQGVQVFITEIDLVDATTLAGSDDLRVVAACRSDAVNVDVAACTMLGIPVLNAPGRNADAVADLTLTFLLMLARRMPEATTFLRESVGEAGDLARMGRAFATLQGRELWHRTVGLVGMGAVGRAVVARLRPFGARCLVFDPFVADDCVRLAGAEPASLSALLAESDFVSLHAAASEATTGLIGAAELAQMRPGTCLVNTARASLVDGEALLAALRSGALAGAALDVFAVEPPAPDDPLLCLDNVIATPHVGGNTLEVASHQGAIVAADLARLMAGERPLHVLNPEVLDAFDWRTPRLPPDANILERLKSRPAPAVTDLLEKST